MHSSWVILLSFTWGNHLRQDFSSSLVVVSFKLHARELLLKLVYPSRLLKDGNFSHLFLLVLTLDVNLLSSPLASNLKQMCTSTLGCYIKEMLKVRNIELGSKHAMTYSKCEMMPRSIALLQDQYLCPMLFHPSASGSSHSYATGRSRQRACQSACRPDWWSTTLAGACTRLRAAGTRGWQGTLRLRPASLWSPTLHIKALKDISLCRSGGTSWCPGWGPWGSRWYGSRRGLDMPWPLLSESDTYGFSQSENWYLHFSLGAKLGCKGLCCKRLSFSSFIVLDHRLS